MSFRLLPKNRKITRYAIGVTGLAFVLAFLSTLIFNYLQDPAVIPLGGITQTRSGAIECWDYFSNEISTCTPILIAMSVFLNIFASILLSVWAVVLSLPLILLLGFSLAWMFFWLDEYIGLKQDLHKTIILFLSLLLTTLLIDIFFLFVPRLWE